MAVAAGVVAARRKPKPPGSAKGKKKPSLTTRLLACPSPLTAFTVRLVLFLPGASYIAAASVIATARTSGAATAGDLALIVVIDVLCVWVPYVLYLFAPDRPPVCSGNLITGWERTAASWSLACWRSLG